ncbi:MULTISPECIES: polysaccharide pyruvyl transferase family protein [Paenibacillus]|uniref:Polysaccharide pyruvyl transferase n=1 Tax=Paenibacillus naphthalenovorans TaxID=162209 RepID=A0A0U2U649_9BACL|nr:MULTISPECIES: polysaccharide pyruvyl transferase family protein [Paenibacillus]ALS21865.1 polysaccharide pyruvyl transferase [Paenibacillus naphthalenovorans]SDI80053.1 Exopolysaccharide biosynthesis protein EpsI, predicted pyruvyl transferase [Paenibacillus naphthalenovorans]
MNKHRGDFSNFEKGLETSRAKLTQALADSQDITFITCGGNIGDYLIWAGTRQLLTQVSYKEITKEGLIKAEGHTALMTGSGGWCKSHGSMPKLLPEIEKRFEKVIVLPSSFDRDLYTVQRVLSNTRALVFAREEESYRQIKDLCHADIAYDCALFFDFAPYRAPGKGELVAYRTDGESARSAVPNNNYDISRRSICKNHEDWLRIIARYESVRTDRAHVMIAAAMLGKKVLYSSSSYHKVPEIAKFSLKDFPVYPE